MKRDSQIKLAVCTIQIMFSYINSTHDYYFISSHGSKYLYLFTYCHYCFILMAIGFITVKLFFRICDRLNSTHMYSVAVQMLLFLYSFLRVFRRVKPNGQESDWLVKSPTIFCRYVVHVHFLLNTNTLVEFTQNCSRTQGIYVWYNRKQPVVPTVHNVILQIQRKTLKSILIVSIDYVIG